MTKGVTRGAALSLIVLLLTAATVVATPSGKTVLGRVTSFDRQMLAVKADSGETVTFALAPDTQYVKWVTQKPLQRSTVADWSFLRVGKRVAVQPAGGERPTSARVVRIATE